MVKKVYLLFCIIAMGILFAIGNKVVSSACDYGRKAGNDYVDQHNGSDKETYDQIFELTTKSHQISGSILSSIGGIGIIIFTYEMSKELSERGCK